MDAERAAFDLKHALPGAATQPRFRRTFATRYRSALLNAGCSDAQIDRLECTALTGITYYAEPVPRLRDVRTLLADLSKTMTVAADTLRHLLDAPPGGAGEEAHGRLLDSILRLYPDRCTLKPEHATGFFEKRIDEREIEVRRLLSVMVEVQTIVRDARQHVPKGQTRAQAHWRPVSLIDVCLSLDGPQFTPSESGPFARIVNTCYRAAGISTEPLRAIRAYLRRLNASPEKNDPSR